ncbi:hypothetical protein FRC17_007464 [Serendipita sp. 399]|nr:hypothetical protein FRC17_007464 [Serendipita sp. 399]
MGSDEYGPRLDAIRPGGMLVTVPLQTTTEHFNVTEQEVYHAIGDKESISLLMISYVTWCHVEPAWPSRFDPARPDSTTRLENVIQYYRASSFALSTPAYNNSLARSALSNATEGSPLPAAIEYSSFRRCIDDVTSKALAILNKPPGLTPKDKFILALIFGGIFIISGAIYVVLITGYSLYLLRSSICGHIMDRYREWQARQERQRKLREMQVQARKASLVYERYP